jgi:hypothetical protein
MDMNRSNGTVDPRGLFTEQPTMNGSNSFNDFDPHNYGRMWQTERTNIDIGFSIPNGNQEEEQSPGISSPNATNEIQSPSTTQLSQLTKREKEIADEKSRRHRQKNREAAKRCRAKKKGEKERLEQAVPQLVKTNAQLRGALYETQEEIIRLRSLLNKHIQCHHPEHQEYFAAQTLKATLFESPIQHHYASHGKDLLYQGINGPPQANNMHMVVTSQYPGQGYELRGVWDMSGAQVPNPRQNLIGFGQNGAAISHPAGPLTQPQPVQLGQSNNVNNLGHQAATSNAVIPSPDSGIIMDREFNASHQTIDGGRAGEHDEKVPHIEVEELNSSHNFSQM